MRKRLAAGVQLERPQADSIADRPGGPAARLQDPDAPPRLRRARLRRAGCWRVLLAAPLLLIAAWASLAFIVNTFVAQRDWRHDVEAAVRKTIIADLPPGSTDEQIQKWMATNCFWTERRVDGRTGDVEYVGVMRWRNWLDSGHIHLSIYRRANGDIYVPPVLLIVNSL